MLSLTYGQFTAPDLSAIASSLDVLEQNVDAANLGSTSTNMDNTGSALPTFLLNFFFVNQ